MIITVDGYAASGKSSLAKEIAKRLNCNYLDAGMMFRAVALAVMTKEKDIDIDFVNSSIYLNGKDVSSRVRDEDVTKFVAEIGGDEHFRDLVYSLEKKKATGCIVASGRDTGTAVFPNANIKFFVEATLDVRAERRFRDYGKEIPLEEIKENLRARDKKDIEYGSLVKPNNAYVIDNSKDSFENVVTKMMDIIG